MPFDASVPWTHNAPRIRNLMATDLESAPAKANVGNESSKNKFQKTKKTIKQQNQQKP